MSRIVWQGGQLLHGLWSHAERAVLRGRPPPTTYSRSNGQTLLHNSRHPQTVLHLASGARSARQASSKVDHHSPESFVESLKFFTHDALMAVFQGIRVPVESGGASMVRGVLQSSRRPVGHSVQSRVAFGTFTRQAGRPSGRFPNATVTVPRSTNQVGLQLARNFSSGTGFEYFVTNAPLALRLAAGQLDDDLRKQLRSNGNVSSRRTVASSTSPRRSSPAMHKKRMEEIVRAYGRAHLQSHSSTASQAESSKNLASFVSTSSSEVVPEAPARSTPSTLSSVETDFEREASLSLSDYDYYFPPSSSPIEPDIVTHLTIPLCPDLSTILSENLTDRDFRDDKSMEDFLRDCYNVTDQYERFRLKRIMAIERAFEQEPLRAYRPASWQDDMLVGYMQNDQPFPDVCLTVPFPHCTAERVTQMLMQTLSRESAMWFSRFLTETAVPAPSESDVEVVGLTDLVDPPNCSPPSSSSSSLIDVRRAVDRMGVASLVSMDDYGDTSSWSAMDIITSQALHSDSHFLLEQSLQFPRVDVPGSYGAE